jgi:hypothetical protein
LSPAPLWKHYAPCVLTQFGRNGDRVSELLPGNGCAVDARFRVIGLLGGCPRKNLSGHTCRTRDIRR